MYKRLPLIFACLLVFGSFLFASRALAASFSFKVNNFDNVPVGTTQTSASATNNFIFHDLKANTDGSGYITITVTPVSFTTAQGGSQTFNVSAFINITNPTRYSQGIIAPAFVYTVNPGGSSVISVSPGLDAGDSSYHCGSSNTYNSSTNITTNGTGSDTLIVDVRFLIYFYDFCVASTGPVPGQTVYGTTQIEYGPPVGITVTEPCVINSFTAANPNPPYGQTTNLSFTLSGTFNWSIVELNNSSTVTAPSGNGSSDTVLTSATSGMQTYRLTCNDGSANPPILDVSVVHQPPAVSATLQVSTVDPAIDNTKWGSSATVTAPQSGQTGPTLWYRWSSANATGGSSTVSVTPTSCPSLGISPAGTSGSVSGAIISSQGGCQYTIRYTATGPGGSADSQITVTINAPGSPVSCSPTNQTVSVGGVASFSAAGGDGSYSWSGGGSPATGTGPTFNTSYSSSGNFQVTVSSAGKSAVCAVSVTPPSLSATLQVSTTSSTGPWASSATVTAPPVGQTGPTLWYRWLSTGAVDGSSAYSVTAPPLPNNCPRGSPDPGPWPWVASGTSGNTSGIVSSEQAGCTYSITYSAQSSLTVPFSITNSTITVIINAPSSTTPTPTPSPVQTGCTSGSTPGLCIGIRPASASVARGSDATNYEVRAWQCPVGSTWSPVWIVDAGNRKIGDLSINSTSLPCDGNWYSLTIHTSATSPLSTRTIGVYGFAFFGSQQYSSYSFLSPSDKSSNLTILDPNPIISLSCTNNCVFVGVQGQTSPINQIFTIANKGGASLTWSSATDAFWVPSIGNGTIGPGRTLETILSANVANMPVGVYKAVITISGNASNSPQIQQVILKLGDTPQALIQCNDPVPTDCSVNSGQDMPFLNNSTP